MTEMIPTNGVRIIKATTPTVMPPNSFSHADRKLRVAAYCRVSTDSDEQENSYEAQCSYYHRYIRSNPGWALAGIYADEGITGTMVKNRRQFQAMIRDCEDGKIDQIITKSVSRFARNTVDCLLTIRRLKELGIPVIFEKEGLNTQTTSSEMLLTFMSSFAQQESESISENVKIGLQMNAKAGKGQLNITHFLGYDRGDAPHTMVINPQQAKVVRRIYREFLDGYSLTHIATRLEQDGVKTATGKGHWHNRTVKSILTNEKYYGALLLQKYYTPDYLTHREMRNVGKLPQYFIEHDHEGIIPESVFWQVQWEMWRRYGEGKVPRRRESALSGRILCGKCGKPMLRFMRRLPEHTYWRCRQKNSAAIAEPGVKCGCRSVDEEDLKTAIINVLNSLRGKYEKLIRKHEGLQNGELKRIDALLAFEDARLKDLEGKTATPGCEATTAPMQIDQIHRHKNALYKERATYADQEVQVRILLELVRQMLTKGNDGWKRLLSQELYENEDVIPEYEDFFNRTAYRIPAEILDANGFIVGYNDDLALRYLKSIIVLDDGYTVQLKAGITMTV